MYIQNWTSTICRYYTFCWFWHLLKFKT